MNRWSVIVASLAMLTASFATTGAQAKDLEDRDWIEVRTANFQVRSIQGKKATLELAQHLELFRAAVSLLTNVSATEAPVPTRIIAVRGKSDFRKLGIDGDAAGIFSPGLRSNMIVIREARGMDETSTMLHEYVHFLIRNHSEQHYPKWYDEGFAEYLGMSDVSHGNFKIGLAAEHRRSSLNYSHWIPMRRILAPDDYADWTREMKAMFYGEAWALVHFLQNRPDREVPFPQDMAKYLELIEQGQDSVEAFETAFAISENKLNRQVKRYLEAGRFRYFRFAVEDLLPGFDVRAVSLTREAAALTLAEAALRFDNLDSAERWFTIAAAGEPTRPHAEAGLGDVRKFRGDYDAAQPHFEQAIALAPDDPYCQLDMAEFWHDRAVAGSTTPEFSEHLDRARTHYVKAWKLNDALPEIYAMYGRTFLTDNTQPEKAVEMLEEARHLLPSHLQIRLSLAQAYARAARTEDAIAAARSVLTWSHEGSDAAKHATKILEELAVDDAPTSPSAAPTDTTDTAAASEIESVGS